ncbi:metallophosphoesterase [Lentilactobacillus sp. Marseille-Q4993]|uniref:metallophosphoesterase n=1 Tax=Lentilactobacillus sp. Marseille-Q4993 TaxID=3039492 RepID=UPI0024BD1732|nr:metallophosphoesterase [Lentilactobacillus sp. Marseille-Q4993]
MVNIYASSDNHFDLNNIDPASVIKAQVEYLNEIRADYYLIAGDLFNDFQKSLTYVANLQSELTNTKVLFIAGNHDMVNGVTYDELENGRWPGYLNNRYIDVPNSDIRIIGLNGWYDYSFAVNVDKSEHQFYTWKETYWIDRLISQPMSDIERERIVLTQLESQLEAAKADSRQVVLMTHFVPNQAFIRYSKDFRFWNMANAVMGSLKFEKILDKYQVKAVVFGHIHEHLNPRRVNDTVYYNSAVGYNRKRHKEWQTDNFLSEWKLQLKKIETF